MTAGARVMPALSVHEQTSRRAGRYNPSQAEKPDNICVPFNPPAVIFEWLRRALRRARAGRSPVK